MHRRIILAALCGFAVVATAQAQPRAIPGIRSLPDLEYAKVGDKSLLLDLYLPEKAEGKLPVIVCVHGGGWMAGDRKGATLLGPVHRGYAVATIEYRLSQEAIFPAQINDCKAAIRWLRAHADQYGLDVNRFGLWGHSAGGHLVALLGTSGDVKDLEGDEGNLQFSSRVQAVADWAGPVDFTADPNQAGKGSGPSLLIGCPVGENRDKAMRASPLSYITPDDPPFLIVHGDHDKLVPVAQAHLLYDALTKAGVPATLLIRPWTGHGLSDPTIWWTQNEFFDKYLKGKR